MVPKPAFIHVKAGWPWDFGFITKLSFSHSPILQHQCCNENAWVGSLTGRHDHVWTVD